MGGRVLSVASEAVPLIKTGGLADVVGALPSALAPTGWEMRLFLPAYRPLRALLVQGGGFREVMREEGLWGGTGRVFAGESGGLSLYLLDAPHLFDREGGPYQGMGGDWPDNVRRFAALSFMAARLAREGVSTRTGRIWKPDILHAHDWQAALAPAYLAYHGAGGCHSVLTIHNIAFQGHAPAADLQELRLPGAEFHADALEYYGGLSTLKAGLVTAERITTVSPNYAAELMRPAYGLGLEGVIAARAGVVSGILNGIDTRVWSPEAEPVNAYSLRAMAGKARARAALEEEFGLSVPGPLAVLVSRLTDQKGIDLLPGVLPGFIAAGGGLAVLGSGDAGLEAEMQDLARRWPGRVSVRIGYDEGMSHRLFQGGDAVLVPSRFEPCGLTQIYGLRYGTIPVVAAVGGLADTVINASPAALAAGVATGISFWPTDALSLSQALRRLVALYADKGAWTKMRRRAMEQENGWEESARAYAALYADLVG